MSTSVTTPSLSPSKKGPSSLAGSSDKTGNSGGKSKGAGKSSSGSGGRRYRPKSDTSAKKSEPIRKSPPQKGTRHPDGKRGGTSGGPKTAGKRKNDHHSGGSDRSSGLSGKGSAHHSRSQHHDHHGQPHHQSQQQQTHHGHHHHSGHQSTAFHSHTHGPSTSTSEKSSPTVAVSAPPGLELSSGERRRNWRDRELRHSPHSSPSGLTHHSGSHSGSAGSGSASGTGTGHSSLTQGISAGSSALTALPLRRMKDAFPMILESVGEVSVSALSEAGRLFRTLVSKQRSSAKKSGGSPDRALFQYDVRQLMILGALPKCHTMPRFETEAPAIIFPRSWAQEWIQSPESPPIVPSASLHFASGSSGSAGGLSGVSGTLGSGAGNSRAAGLAPEDDSTTEDGSAGPTRADVPNWRVRQTPQMSGHHTVDSGSGMINGDSMTTRMDDFTLTNTANDTADEWVPPPSMSGTAEPVVDLTGAPGSAAVGGDTGGGVPSDMQGAQDPELQARHFTPELKPDQGEDEEETEDGPPAWDLEEGTQGEFERDFTFQALDTANEKAYWEKYGRLPEKPLTVSLDEYEAGTQTRSAVGPGPLTKPLSGVSAASLAGSGAAGPSRPSGSSGEADSLAESERIGHSLHSAISAAMPKSTDSRDKDRVYDTVAAMTGHRISQTSGSTLTGVPVGATSASESGRAVGESGPVPGAVPSSGTTGGSGSSSRKNPPRPEEIDPSIARQWANKYGSQWYRAYVSYYHKQQQRSDFGRSSNALDSCKTIENVEYYHNYYRLQYENMKKKTAEDPKYLDYVRYYERKLELVAAKMEEFLERGEPSEPVDFCTLDLSSLGYTSVSQPTSRSHTTSSSAASTTVASKSDATSTARGTGGPGASASATAESGSSAIGGASAAGVVPPSSSASASGLVGFPSATAAAEEAALPPVPESSAEAKKKIVASRLSGVESLGDIQQLAAAFAHSHEELKMWASEGSLSVSGRPLDDYLPFYETDGVFTMRSQRGTLYLLLPVEGKFVRVPFWFLDGFLHYCEKYNPKANASMLHAFWQRYLRFKYEQNEYQKAVNRGDGSASALQPPQMRHEKKMFLVAVEHFRRTDKQRKERQAQSAVAAAAAAARIPQGPPQTGSYATHEMYHRMPPSDARYYGQSLGAPGQRPGYPPKEDSGVAWSLDPYAGAAGPPPPAHHGHPPRPATETISPSYYPSAY